MGALDKAGPLDDRPGNNARLAQQLETDACAYDVHDGIHCADFVKVNLLRWHAVDFSFRNGDAMEDSQCLFFYPRRQLAAGNEVKDHCVVSTMFVGVIVILVIVVMLVFVRMLVPLMFVLVTVLMVMRVRVRMSCSIGVSMFMRMGVSVSKVHIELNAFNRCLVGARRMQMEAIQAEFVQLVLELVKIDPSIKERADKHIAANPTEDVEVKSLHPRVEPSAASELIWLAA
jgi:hypothetical protein